MKSLLAIQIGQTRPFNLLDDAQKNLLAHCIQFTTLLYKKRPEFLVFNGQKFSKNKYGSKCLELPNLARKAKKNFFACYKISKASWLSVKGQKAIFKS